jgi:hypothetical protein
MAKNDPFNPNAEDTAADEAAAETELPEGMVSLGDAATSALSEFGDEGSTQDPLDGTDYLKVKFMGMSMDSLEDEIELGSMMTFTVQARCIGEGTDISKQDGHKKRFVKMDVQSVKVVTE